jgi:C-terminal processing protease CtpA/Prc
VIDLVTGGAAERAGIRVDDDITRVNGLNFTDIILPDLRESWSKLPAGTVVKLQIKRHQAVLRKTLKLKSLV